MKGARIMVGDVRAELAALEDDLADCCVTSPPYWKMRNYGHESQLGLEDTVDEFVDALADVLDQVRRVLKPSGTCWLNLGDSYIQRRGGWSQGKDMRRRYLGVPARRRSPGLKLGDLCGIPWRVALECQRRGWYLRSEIVWHKTNAIPDGNASRPMTAHEHLFLLTRSGSADYYYDTDAVRTPLSAKTSTAWGSKRRSNGHDGSGLVRAHNIATDMPERRPECDTQGNPKGAKLRSVWPIATESRHGVEGHFALMAYEVARRCVLLGCPEGGVVLDPFTGAGTTAIAALRTGRRFLGIELVDEYAEVARRRLEEDAPLLNSVAVARPGPA